MRAAELRRQIRHWRRGRADARLVDVLNDAYVAVFSAGLIGVMAGSVVLNAGELSARSCHAGPCQSARFWGPWLIALTAVAVAGALCRIVGPVFVAPATASWLLSTPVERRSFLRGPLLLVASTLAGVTGLVALAAAGFTGFQWAAVALGGGAMLATITATCAWAALQSMAPPPLVTAAVAWLPILAIEVALIAAWRGLLDARDVPRQPTATGWSALVGLLVLSCVVGAVAFSRLDRLRDRDLSAGGRLSTALSGALATLDLALVYDVVTSQRWLRRGHVRARRRGPAGVSALVWLDVVRVARRPSLLLLLVAVAPATYAAAAFGAGRGTALVAVVVGFLGALPLLLGLRVLTRTAGLARMLPFSSARIQAAALVVPGGCLLGYGALVAGAAAAPVPIALASLAAATRWVTGRPPDYSRPLVSTPAGAVPANLYGSVFRGFDIALIAGVPLLGAGVTGQLLSIAISFVVLTVLVRRPPAR